MPFHICASLSQPSLPVCLPPKSRDTAIDEHSTAIKIKMSDPNNYCNLPSPVLYSTTDDPLSNLSAIQNQVDSLSQTLSNSVNASTPLSTHDTHTINAEWSSAIHHIIINGGALIASSYGPHHRRSDGDDFKIVELDVMELTADHSHTCTICGKGFRRDANLRMHMRAPGDQFKSPISLSKPNDVKIGDNYGPKTRFSCPYGGCNRNKQHRDFRPLKSVVCAKNHFNRSHCPKFSCCRCKKRCFSLSSDLKSHMKHCRVQLQDDRNNNSSTNLDVVDEDDKIDGFEFGVFRLIEDKQCIAHNNGVFGICTLKIDFGYSSPSHVNSEGGVSISI